MSKIYNGFKHSSKKKTIKTKLIYLPRSNNKIILKKKQGRNITYHRTDSIYHRSYIYHRYGSRFIKCSQISTLTTNLINTM